MNDRFKEGNRMINRISKLKKRRKNVRVLACGALSLFCVLLVFVAINRAVPPKEYSEEISNTNSAPINVVSSQEAEEEEDWKLVLVNQWNALVPGTEIPLMSLREDCQIDQRIYPDLQALFDAAHEDGIYPHVNSAYRTDQEQKQVLTDKINAYLAEGNSKKEAEKLSKAQVAAVGTSEHQLGLALDLNADKDNCTNEQVYEWLNQNSYRFGFIMRYPADKSNITGVDFEPWHYRYVGREAAKEIYDKRICLEEYLNELQ